MSDRTNVLISLCKGGSIMGFMIGNKEQVESRIRRARTTKGATVEVYDGTGGSQFIAGENIRTLKTRPYKA